MTSQHIPGLKYLSAAGMQIGAAESHEKCTHSLINGARHKICMHGAQEAHTHTRIKFAECGEYFIILGGR